LFFAMLNYNITFHGKKQEKSFARLQAECRGRI